MSSMKEKCIQVSFIFRETRKLWKIRQSAWIVFTIITRPVRLRERKEKLC